VNELEPRRYHERVVIDLGDAAEEPRHWLAAEEFLVRGTPLRRVRVPAPLGVGVLVAHRANRHDAHLGYLDDGGGLAVGVEHDEPLARLRYRVASVLVELQQPGHRGLVPSQDGGDPTIPERSGRG
jgi:hypothetical protein